MGSINEDLVKSIIDTSIKVLSSSKFKKTIFGTYSDGTARSLVDSVNGEVLSPKQKKNKIYKKKKVKNRKIRL